MLISETHFTGKSYIRIPRYTVYHTNHPAGTAQGGTALILKSSIQHHPLNPYGHSILQATTVTVEGTAGPLTISAVYSYLPPRHSIQQEELEDFFDTLGRRFIAGGDYNAKHTEWGSRLASPRGRVLLKTLENRNYRHLSSGEPTYWPTDLNKLPDLLDFFVTKGSHSNFVTAKSCFKLSSDHSPVLVLLSTQPSLRSPPPRLYNRGQIGKPSATLSTNIYNYTSLLKPNPTLRTQSRISTTQSSGQPGIQRPHTLMYNAPTIAQS
jgi:hypothetical protein